ncbi:MAG: 3-phosphoshikimate 1-carboxyvinyltransferase 2 [Phycisphaerae bacterium]
MLEVFRQPVSELPAALALPAPRVPLRAFEISLRPPGSKSLTNRALLLAALADGRSVLRRPLVDADDAQRMIAALEVLGARFDTTPTGDIEVAGVSGSWKVPPAGVTVNLNNAGTATRFLAAAAVLAPAPVTIDGNARMRQRPIGELGTALQQVGAKVEYLMEAGFPPMRVAAPADPSHLRSSIRFPTTQSSQFISALALIGPWINSGLTIRLEGEITSASYILMTIRLLERLGAVVRHSADLRVLRVCGPDATRRGLPAFDLSIEPDASGATYFWGAAALVPGAKARIMGLGAHSLQGDADFPDVLGSMGATVTKSAAADPWIQVVGPPRLAPIMADLADMPDTAMTLAAVTAFADGTSVLKGLRTLRVKETDRIAAIQQELGKLGVTVTTPISGDEGAISITPPPGGVDCSASCPTVEFETYDDHRMAMSMALIGLRRPNVVIKHPSCVAKTYATFWSDFARML